MVMTSRPPPRTNKTRSSPSMSTSRNSISCAQSLKERHSTQHDDAQARAFLRVGKILYENICRVYHKMCVLEADTKCTNLTTRTLTLADTVQWRETRMMSAYRKLQAQMMRSVQLYVITTAAHPHFHAVSQKSSTRRRLVETDSPIHLEAAPDKLNMIFQHWFKVERGRETSHHELFGFCARWSVMCTIATYSIGVEQHYLYIDEEIALLCPFLFLESNEFFFFNEGIHCFKSNNRYD